MGSHHLGNRLAEGSLAAGCSPEADLLGGSTLGRTCCRTWLLTKRVEKKAEAELESTADVRFQLGSGPFLTDNGLDLAQNRAE